MTRRARISLGAAAVLACATVGAISVHEVRDQLAVIEACDALEEGDLDRTLELTRDRTGGDATGRTAAECRCRALIARGERERCTTLLEELASDADWMPPPDLLEPTLDALTRRTSEAAALEALAQRLPADGAAAARSRALLAQRHLRRGDAAAALRTLGPTPPDGAGGALALWFDTRLHAHVQGGDVQAGRRARSEWLAAGGDPATVRARYALALSIAGLSDPETDTIALLRRSLDETTGSPDTHLREGLAVRLVLTLAGAGRIDEALLAYDTHVDELGLDGLRREELVRAARRERLADVPAVERRGTLHFHTGRGAGRVLLLSPDEGVPVDAPFERVTVPHSGEIAVARVEGEAPTRWVLREARGVVASGTVNPLAGGGVDVWIAPKSDPATMPAHVRARARADGRTRVVLVLLDCGDWRIVRYLRARGELPVLATLLRDGTRAVLESDPPLTAAALESLVWPGRDGGASLIGLVHRMGVELAGLASVGDNPFSGLRVVLPESDDLFSRIGAGDRSAANLLLAHGGIRAGRHGEVWGPEGRRRRVPIGRAARDLTPDERLRWPALADPGSERDLHYLRTIAAEFDATLELARSGEHDLVAVRIEPLDILTHARFAETTRNDQDDGERLLYSVYRYVDARLGAVDAALDEDDVLVVMSDHGIRTAMEHSRDALFVATGGGVPAGVRIDGRPDLRGVPRALADWLGVETGWPDTGLGPGRAPALAATAGGGAE